MDMAIVVEFKSMQCKSYTRIPRLCAHKGENDMFAYSIQCRGCTR